MRHLHLLLAILPFSASFILMAHSEPLGLVLSGGGAKGAYEVGVWQALLESGVSKDIRAISGTSVGAINAALFATVRDSEKCSKLWEEEVGGLFQFNTNLLVKILGEEGKTKVECAYAQMRKNIEDDCTVEAAKRGCKETELPQEVRDAIEAHCESVARKRLFLQLPKWKAFANMLYDYDESQPLEGFLPSSKLHSIILRELPKSWSRKTPATYATALRKEKDGFTITCFSLKTARPEQRASMICASACIPLIFGAYEVDGATYVDGGYEAKGGDNVPLAPILENHPEIKTVIIVYLDVSDDPTTKNRIARNEAAAKEFGVTPIAITPSKGIGGLFGWGGVFDASPETARQLMELGRKDAEAKLREAGLWPRTRRTHDER